MPPTTAEAPTLDRSELPKTTAAAEKTTGLPRAIQAVGYSDSGAATAFLGAAMFGTAEHVAEVLEFVEDTDFEPGEARIVEALRALSSAGHPPDAVSVGDWLTRHGRITRAAQHALAQAVTAGANPGALRTYAAAVVSGSFRLAYAALGAALLESADDLPEHDLMPQLVDGGTRMRAHHRRLAILRGEHN